MIISYILLGLIVIGLGNIGYTFLQGKYTIQIGELAADTSLILLCGGIIITALGYQQLPEIVKEKIMKRISTSSELIERGYIILKVVITVWMAYVIISLYTLLQKLPNECGEIISSSWLKIKKVLSLEEKKEGLRKIGESLTDLSRENWEKIAEKINVTSIESYDELKKVVKSALMNELKNSEKITEKITQKITELKTPWYTGIYEKLSVIEPKYYMYGVGIVVTGVIIYYNGAAIVNGVKGIISYCKEPKGRSIGEIISNSFTEAKKMLQANAELASVQTTIVKHADELEKINNLLTKGMLKTMEQQTTTIKILTTIKEELVGLNDHKKISTERFQKLVTTVEKLSEYVEAIV